MKLPSLESGKEGLALFAPRAGFDFAQYGPL
jgi:hypothetical protein